MKNTILIFSLSLLMTACASKRKLDHAKLEKYPKCYHQNSKISHKCIEKNEAGENVTAADLENTAYPGQYQ